MVNFSAASALTATRRSKKISGTYRGSPLEQQQCFVSSGSSHMVVSQGTSATNSSSTNGGDLAQNCNKSSTNAASATALRRFIKATDSWNLF